MRIKIKLIYNSIDSFKIESFKQESIWNYSFLFDNGKFNFVTVWRLNKIKNQKLMIKSFVELNKKSTNTTFDFGWMRVRNELKIASNNENIHFLWNQKMYLNFYIIQIVLF